MSPPGPIGVSLTEPEDLVHLCEGERAGWTGWCRREVKRGDTQPLLMWASLVQMASSC